MLWDNRASRKKTTKTTENKKARLAVIEQDRARNEGTLRNENYTDDQNESSESESCRRCGAPLVSHLREFSNGTKHLEQRCTRGHFITFLPQYKTYTSLPFGMHKGVPFENLPRDYVRWLLTKHLSRSLRKALEQVQ